MWRSWDKPMTGTIFRLPDDMHLQRGITYTILPDGRSVRVPSMNKLQVHASAQSHDEDDDHDMMQALQDILMGKKPTKGRASFNRRGRAGGNRVNPGVRGRAPVRGDLLRSAYDDDADPFSQVHQPQGGDVHET